MAELSDKGKFILMNVELAKYKRFARLLAEKVDIGTVNGADELLRLYKHFELPLDPPKGKEQTMPEVEEPESEEDRESYLRQLAASGYMGINTSGHVVDRREVPDAMPLPKNEEHGIATPQEVIVPAKESDMPKEAAPF